MPYYEDPRAACLILCYKSPLGIQNICPRGVRHCHVEILDSQFRHYHHYLGVCEHSLNATTLPHTLRVHLLLMIYDFYHWDRHLFDVLHFNDVALVNWHARCMVLGLHDQVIMPLTRLQRYLELVLPRLISRNVA